MHAMCNSACGYLFLGATSREVAPDAVLAVHNSRLVLNIQREPPPEVLAEIRQRRMATAERVRAAFIAAMGISRELDDLIRTVTYENLHVLTRAELYRFGIDTRPFAEGTWRLETGARPFISKIAVTKTENGSSFRTMEWRMVRIRNITLRSTWSALKNVELRCRQSTRNTGRPAASVTAVRKASILSGLVVNTSIEVTSLLRLK